MIITNMLVIDDVVPSKPIYPSSSKNISKMQIHNFKLENNASLSGLSPERTKSIILRLSSKKRLSMFLERKSSFLKKNDRCSDSF